MKSREETDAIIHKAISIFDNYKNFIHIMGHLGKCTNPFFFNNHIVNCEKRKLQQDLLARLQFEIDNFNQQFSRFCKKYNIDEQKIVYESQKSSDYYMAIVIELLKVLKETENYRFVFMGVPYHLENFSGKIKSLRYAGNLLITLGLTLFLIILPTILFTQPFTVPIIITLLLVITLLTLFISYCGAMISENQMPFSSEDLGISCTITQVFGAFKQVKEIDIEESEDLSSNEYVINESM